MSSESSSSDVPTLLHAITAGDAGASSRLLQAGVSVELHSYPGTFHGSGLIPNAEPSRRNAAEVISVLKRRLA